MLFYLSAAYMCFFALLEMQAMPSTRRSHADGSAELQHAPTYSLTATTVCPARHLTERGLFRLNNRTPCVAKAPGWSCDRHAKEGGRRPR